MTDNQDSVTADAVQPPTDRPLTAGDVPLLKRGDILRSPARTHEVRRVWASVIALEYGEFTLSEFEAARFGFVSRPATSAASEVEGNGVIRLSKAEVQSGLDRQRYAELLILQLPETHDGRNTWLLNYGTGPEAQAKRAAWNKRALKDGRDPSCTFNASTNSTGVAALASPPVSERERELEGALRLAATAIGCLTFDDDIRSIIGNTNFEILKANAAEIRRLTAQPAGEGK